MEWPSRSPDLIPLDFFLWGHLKSRVYINRPNNLQDLIERIRHEMILLSPQIIKNSVNQVYHRWVCVKFPFGKNINDVITLTNLTHFFPYYYVKRRRI
jgi:hypothetical protein